MSTLNSTNMSINRPTTRVHHAPGGASSLSLFGSGNDDVPATKTTKPAFNPSFEPSKPAASPVMEEAAPMPQEPTVEAAPTPVPVVKKAAAPAPEPAPVAAVVKPAVAAVATMTTAPAPVPTTAACVTPLGIACVATGEANAALKARAMAMLAARGVGEVCVVEVGDALLLPAAAKRMAASGKVRTVLALAAMATTGETAAAVASGLVAASVDCPAQIVPGVVFGPSMAEGPLAAWVAAAVGMANMAAEEEAFVVVPTSHGSVKPITTIEPVVPVSAGTPDKKMADMSLSSASKEEPAPVMDTPTRRVRGAGPSSIVFG